MHGKIIAGLHATLSSSHVGSPPRFDAVSSLVVNKQLLRLVIPQRVPFSVRIPVGHRPSMVTPAPLKQDTVTTVRCFLSPHVPQDPLRHSLGQTVLTAGKLLDWLLYCHRRSVTDLSHPDSVMVYCGNSIHSGDGAKMIDVIAIQHNIRIPFGPPILSKVQEYY